MGNFILAEIIEKIKNSGISTVLNPNSSWSNVITYLLDNSSCCSNHNLSKSISYWKMQFEKEKSVSIGETLGCVLISISNKFGADYERFIEDPFYREKKIETYIIANTDSFKNWDSFSKVLKSYIGSQRMSINEYDKLNEITMIVKSNDLIKLKKYVYTNKNSFEDNPSDKFLYEVLEQFYHFAHYDLIDTFIIDKFQNDNILKRKEYKLFKAHTLGQVGKFEEAVKELSDITFDSDSEKVDILTSMISNMLRHALYKIGYKYSLDARSQKKLDSTRSLSEQKEYLKEVIEKALDQYSDVFQISEHYYPGINYAYILSLYELIYGTTHDDGDMIENIYESSKTSIIDEKEALAANINNRYYPMISDLEFQALLGDFDQNKFNTMIKESNPTKDQLSRTLRQLIFYQDILDVFDRSKECPESIRSLDKEIRQLL